MIWGIIVIVGLNAIYNFFNLLPVNFMDQLGSLSNVLIATFPLFPAVAAGLQFGTKHGVSLTAIIIATLIIFTKLPPITIGGLSLSLNASGMAMLVGMIVLIIFAAREGKNKDSSEEGVMSIFGENVTRIRKNWLWFVFSGGFVCAGTALSIITVGLTSAKLISEVDYVGAGMFTLAGAIGYIPLVYTTAIVTGVFTPASRFVLAVGMFMPLLGWSPLATAILAFIIGGMISTLETLLLGGIGKVMDSYPSMRDMGNHIRTSMSEILEVALLVGSFIAAGAIGDLVGLGAVGSLVVMAAWVLNKNAKKPLIMQMAVGPVVTIFMGILVNILVIVGLATPIA